MGNISTANVSLFMTENISFREDSSLRIERRQEERGKRIEKLRRELAEARVDLDKAIIALGRISPLGRFVRGKEYKESLDVFQKASKQVRRICNALENEFVTGEEVSGQSNASSSSSSESTSTERGQQESWERNIPRRNGQ